MKIKAVIAASIIITALAGCSASENHENTVSTPTPGVTESGTDHSITDDAGDAVKDITDGAGKAVEDAGNGVGNAVKDITK